LAWSPDSQLWAVGNESGEAKIYDTQGRQVAAMQNPSGNVDALGWSPDGRTLAGGDGVAFWQADGTLLAQHQSFGRVHSLAWSPDGQLLASASEDGVVRLWSADGRSMVPLPGNGGPNTTVTWSPRAQTLAVGSQDGSVRLWTLAVSAAQLFQSVSGDVYDCPLTVPGSERPSDPTSHSFGAYWFKSADGLIWASPGAHLHVGGNKVGWSRPAGAELQVSGRRLDVDSPPMTADLPCCYPDHFQASGLYFPTEGCWEVTARAGASDLKFVVRVGPAP
jgi:WD40 repeat protein